jgi:2-polyprenyl-3-methyl-5-hydroxy-6-metoxy-1,4-benzoquinol methylase
VPSVEQHYDQVLADVYAWMLGGFDAALGRNRELLAKLGIAPQGSRLAIDLGAGCGFQSIPLAELGFTVTAIDLDRKLLDELRAHSGGLDIEIVHDDLQRFEAHARGRAELVVCMLDTLLHLESKDAVRTLLAKVHATLEPGGKLIVTFRDLSRELTGLDRFLSVRSDDRTILTCFLEFEPETVKVHDLVHRKQASGWTLHKSYYRKLRLAPEWVLRELRAAGFRSVDSSIDRGLFTMIAVR